MTQDFSGDLVEESTGRLNLSASLFKLFATSHVVLTILVVWFGGFILHIWTAYLFAKNWGLFWAVIALFFPVFSELVAVINCFHWGVWFYVLAVAAYILGFVSFGLVDLIEVEGSKMVKIFFGASAMTMYILLGCFGFFAIRAAILPKPLSENERREIEDVNGAVCAVLNSCASLDPTVASDLAEAKDRLRRRIGKYDAVRMGELRRKVDAYLRARLLMERDLKAYLLSTKVPEQPFAFSAETHEAIGFLPAIMQPTELEVAAIEELRQQVSSAKSGGVSWAALGVKLRPALQLEWQRQWRVMGEVYEDLLGAPIPTREELERRR